MAAFDARCRRHFLLHGLMPPLDFRRFHYLRCRRRLLPCQLYLPPFLDAFSLSFLLRATPLYFSSHAAAISC